MRDSAHETTSNIATANFDIEKGLLGAILINADVMRSIPDVTPEDFYVPDNGIIFETLRQMIADGMTPRPHNTAHRLEKMIDMGAGQTVLQYLGELLLAGTTAQAAPDYAADLVEMAQRRRLIAMSQVAIAMAASPMAVRDIAADLSSELDVVVSATSRSNTKAVTFEKGLADYFDALTADDGANRITTGLASLDETLGGWHRGQLAIIAGRPSMGKTAVGLSALLRTAQAGHGVLFFSLEMPRNELFARALSDLSYSERGPNVPFARALNSKLVEDDARIWFDTRNKFEKLPIVIDDRGGISLAELGARTRAEAQRMGRAGQRLSLVMVDHLGLMRGSDRYAGNRVQEIGETTAGLKALAKDLGVAVVALCQLNRSVENRENKRPGLSDLRDSGTIEQDADSVMFVYREGYYLERLKSSNDDEERERLHGLSKMKHSLEVQVAKNRNGPTVAVDLFCDMAFNVIRDAVP